MPVPSVATAFFALALALRFSTSQASADYYFINCGSANGAALAGRTFAGDLESAVSRSFALSAGDAWPSPPPLYRTARVHSRAFWYGLDIATNGTFLVRLHFFPFPSPAANLSAAVFDVSASGFSLLSNFSAANRTDSPQIREFLLPLTNGRFRIFFVPSKQASIAFVNAIEVFLAYRGGNFAAAGSHPPLVTPAGSSANYSGLLLHALRTLHRVNVGGSAIAPEGDKLWRNWVQDDDYIIDKNSAINSTPFSRSLDNNFGFSNDYIAPELVYRTAKEMAIAHNRSSNFNITWRFGVCKNTRHFVRAHFCDIIGFSPSSIVFNLYIYNMFHWRVNPYALYSPFYFDFVVESDDSGFINFSIGPWIGSQNKTAFLNGLEVMEFMKESDFWVPENRPENLRVILGSAGGGLALLCVLTLALFFRLKHTKKKHRKLQAAQASESGENTSDRKTVDRASNSSVFHDLDLGLKIPLAEILKATHNFDRRLIIGEGGFGKVYQGTLRGGKVAVKRSEPGHGQGVPEFHTEILVLSKIRHRHLVSLIGYCDDYPEMVLVYEFMEKGTLREHLYTSKTFNSSKRSSSARSTLSWKQRLDICIGSAQGLYYLHTSSDRGIIHRDVKSTNILLDEHYIAKVGDFGLSRLGPLEQTHVSTNVKGSIGYLDPEYFKWLQLTEKSDVYSFGVVLLEVLCARPPINNLLPRDEVNLAEWAMSHQEKGKLEEIIDSSLMGQINPNSLRKFGETIEKCLKESGAERPAMRDVLWDLEYALQLQQTEVPGELYDSTILGLPLHMIQCLASYSFDDADDDGDDDDDSDNADDDVEDEEAGEEKKGADLLMAVNEDSGAAASEVFSQLRVHNAR